MRFLSGFPDAIFPNLYAPMDALLGALEMCGATNRANPRLRGLPLIHH
jgi:hypothetical protein